jgi:C4-dicarboxylate-specific signal transduction histidine kinase
LATVFLNPERAAGDNMTDRLATESSQLTSGADAIKNWVMVAITLIFITLYGAALVGWLRPLADEKMVMRLEPIIFLIIGYYFGRLPAQQTEKTLKDEIGRQTQKADAAQHAKEQAQQARETLEEKVKNARAALTPATSVRSLNDSGAGIKEELNRSSVAAAFSILNS